MPDVLQTRGSCIESVHPFSAVAVTDDGQPMRVLGEDRPTTWRSAAKPFQLAVALELLGDPEMPPESLAVGAASHSAEPVHLALVRGLLDRFRLDPAGLRCGAHPPAHVPTAEAILRAGGSFSDLHNNCSGKHAFMLAAALHQGWDPDYRPPTHPLQRAIVDRVASWTGTSLALATDGCGVPTFCLRLSGIARAWMRLAVAMAAEPEGRMGRIGGAMAAHPHLTSGTGRFDLAVAGLATEAVAVKIGAMGVFCVALPARRMGVAVKVHSGNTDALAAALPAVLQAFAPGSLVVPADWSFRCVHNVVGAVVGSWDVAKGVG